MHACTGKQAQRWSHQCGTETWSRSCCAARRVRDATKSVTPACSRACARNASGACLVVSRWRSAWISSGIQTHCKAAYRGAPMAWCVLSSLSTQTCQLASPKSLTRTELAVKFKCGRCPCSCGERLQAALIRGPGQPRVSGQHRLCTCMHFKVLFIVYLGAVVIWRGMPARVQCM